MRCRMPSSRFYFSNHLLGILRPIPISGRLPDQRVACIPCREHFVAPRDHIAYKHGVENLGDRWVILETHNVKVCEDAMGQHLI